MLWTTEPRDNSKKASKWYVRTLEKRSSQMGSKLVHQRQNVWSIENKLVEFENKLTYHMKSLLFGSS